MAENSKIEWTHHTFNPWWGCVKVSAGCEHCYAESFSKRTGHDIWGPAKTTSRRIFGDKHWAEPVQWNQKAKEVGERHRVFCASMADVFEDHPQVAESRYRLLNLIVHTPHLDWLLLTKRPENVNRLIEQATGFSDASMWFHSVGDHVWIGTSVEDQAAADKRIPELLNVPAAVRFLSCEPLLGPVDLRRYLQMMWLGLGEEEAMLHWVIVGGESGPKARPMHPDWARALRDQCTDAGVPFFFKQWGEYIPGYHDGWHNPGQPMYVGDAAINMIRAGKKAAGRLLDGREWSEFPPLAVRP